eukprot:TRINITY_DN860_c4_g1_i1.p1 TRINITY_DN860_c4_g1~~TRINITY_DN860_c4_g1_i1.p1  ORF type:complete len:228 (+),score=48.86 TRINITY_DN860_c4_g1_i1:34-684(+)
MRPRQCRKGLLIQGASYDLTVMKLRLAGFATHQVHLVSPTCYGRQDLLVYPVQGNTEEADGPLRWVLKTLHVEYEGVKVVTLNQDPRQDTKVVMLQVRGVADLGEKDAMRLVQHFNTTCKSEVAPGDYEVGVQKNPSPGTPGITTIYLQLPTVAEATAIASYRLPAFDGTPYVLTSGQEITLHTLQTSPKSHVFRHVQDRREYDIPYHTNPYTYNW